MPKAATKQAKGAKVIKANATARQRPTYDKAATADHICELLASGQSLRKILQMPGMPTMTTVMRWLEDEANDRLREQYARAREMQADRMAEEILEIADEECTMVRSEKHTSSDDDGDGNTEVVFDSVAVQRNRLRVDARKWLASKMAPKKYGDKIGIGQADGFEPLQNVTRIELVPLTR